MDLTKNYNSSWIYGGGREVYVLEKEVAWLISILFEDEDKSLYWNWKIKN